MPLVIKTDHSVVNTDGAIIKANHCVVNGDRCIVTGDHNVINGDKCIVRGDYNIINGDHCEVHGDYNTINGRFATGPGTETFRRGPIRRPANVTVGSGLSVMNGGSVSFGMNGMTVSTGGMILNFRDDGDSGNTVRLVKDDGVYEYSGSGHANVHDGKIFLDGVDITQACKVHSSSSSSSSSSSLRGSIRNSSIASLTQNFSSSSSSSQKRRREEEEEPRKKKTTSPYPVDQKAVKAEEDEKACCACEENKIDTRLKPCGHTVLCIDCARKIYKEEAKRKCPICNRKIEKIQTVFL